MVCPMRNKGTCEYHFFRQFLFCNCGCNLTTKIILQMCFMYVMFLWMMVHKFSTKKFRHNSQWLPTYNAISNSQWSKIRPGVGQCAVNGHHNFRGMGITPISEKCSRSGRAILPALGEFQDILGVALRIQKLILGIRNSILGTTWAIRKPQFLEQLPERFPKLMGTHTQDFICPCILGALSQEPSRWRHSVVELAPANQTEESEVRELSGKEAGISSGTPFLRGLV